MKRKPRKGEYTCNCRAYEFPHRMGGGACSPSCIAVEHFEKTYGADKTCQSCNCLGFDDRFGRTCTVVEGSDPYDCCEVVLEFIRFNEVKCKAK